MMNTHTTQKLWNIARAFQEDTIPIQKTVEVTMFVGITVSFHSNMETVDDCDIIDGAVINNGADGDRELIIFLGLMGDKFECDAGLVWHQRVLMCDWPFNLPPTDPCYEPL